MFQLYDSWTNVQYLLYALQGRPIELSTQKIAEFAGNTEHDFKKYMEVHFAKW